MYAMLKLTVFVVMLCNGVAADLFSRIDARVAGGPVRRAQACNTQAQACLSPSNYPYIQQLVTGMSNIGKSDYEHLVGFLKDISIPTVCSEAMQGLNCYEAAIRNLPAGCVLTAAGSQKIEQLSSHIRLHCVESPSNLIEFQECLSFDLVTDVACCAVKEVMSSSCSAQDVLDCAQDAVSAACSPAIGNAFRTEVDWFQDVSTSNATFCPPVTETYNVNELLNVVKLF